MIFVGGEFKLTGAENQESQWQSAVPVDHPMFGEGGTRDSDAIYSAPAVCQAKTEILPFRLMVIIVGIMVEVFGYPELLSIFINDAVNTVAVILCNVFCMRGHRARPLLSVGDSTMHSTEHAILKCFGNPMITSEKSISSRITSVNAWENVSPILGKKDTRQVCCTG